MLLAWDGVLLFEILLKASLDSFLKDLFLFDVYGYFVYKDSSIRCVRMVPVNV